MTPELWREPTAPLEELVKLLGIPGESHQHESPDVWRFTGDVDSRRLAEPAAFETFVGLLPQLRKKYGAAVTLRLRVRNWPVLELDRDHEEPELDGLHDAIAAGSALTLDLKIVKNDLLVHWNLTDASILTRLFLFPQALARALSIPLTELDQGGNALFKDAIPGQKLVILVPAHDIELDGDSLAILGGEAVSRWRESILATTAAERATWLASISALAHKHLKWVHFELVHLTPLHLNVRWKKDAADGDPIASALHAQLLVCSVLYLAGRSTRNATSGRWTATFASDRQETDAEIGGPAGASKKDWEASCTLAELAAWTYAVDRDADDRLIVVQRVILSALQNNTAALNGTELVRLAGELSKRIQWGWESFIGGRLEKYFSQVKELEETVESTTHGYTEQVQALTKAAIDNMLAAVAVIVGSFIAAMFKSPFQGYAFRFGTGAYATYLLLFPMTMGLRATWERFQKSRESFETRRRSFATRLTVEQVQAIVEPAVADSERWFKRWYWTTVAGYVAVLSVLVVAIVVVPGFIRSWGDAFTLQAVVVHQPASGVVPLTVRGENFDKDKEIVVTLGRATFTNTTDPASLKVHGSTVLAFSPRQEDLANRTLTVRQGTAGPKTIELPGLSPSAGPAPGTRSTPGLQ